MLEGLPGLAKTLAVTTLAKVIDCDFKRIQFTPDLLPADLVGTTIYNPKDGTFSVKNKNERIGRNPKTGEEAIISRRNVLSFRPAHIMKKRMQIGNK